MWSSTTGSTAKIKENTNNFEYYKKLLKVVYGTLTIKNISFSSATRLPPTLPHQL